MILRTKFSQKTHYETMGVKEDASHEEIRKTYRMTILNCHPDKQLQMTSETSNHIHGSENKFLEVQTAWEILSDPRSRALYDNDLQILRQNSATAYDLRLQDMTVEDAGDCFELSYRCRCGDCFLLDSLELEEMGHTFFRNGSKISLQTSGSLPASIVLPCGSCSTKVLLYVDAEVTLQV
ncbi:uncharacterized protein [Henckelia pumila]|uniref:uncharacterized protein n=1 Tax=Henckelia pumila TaxID=405737 RepID=UPI003C6DD460